MRSDETKEEIRRRWVSGESAGFIAAAMGMTRNALLGVVHRSRKRWGLALRDTGPERSGAPRTEVARKPRQPRQPVAAPPRAVHPWAKGVSRPPRVLPASTMPLPTEGTVRFIDRMLSQCAYPMWDRFDVETSMCCGLPRKGEGPYCEAHDRLTSSGLPVRRAA